MKKSFFKNLVIGLIIGFLYEIYFTCKPILFCIIGAVLSGLSYSFVCILCDKYMKQ